MSKVKVHTVSLGCPKNRVDTERLLGALGVDLVPEDDPARADLLLVNTCGFIRPAIEESLSTILGLSDRLSGLEARPVLAVAGCLVSRFGQELQDRKSVV